MPMFLLLLRIHLLVLSALLFTGCVTRGYKLAAKNTPPPVPLNLVSAPANAAPDATVTEPAPASVMVNTVIVYQGPGSWKREAYWDEYVLTVANPTDAPLIVTEAMLHANSGELSVPGDSPWTLERAGKQWWQTNAARQTGTYLALGAGTVAGAGFAVAAALSGGLFAPVTGAAAVGVGVGTAAVVALPIVALGSVGMNLHRKHQIQDEFTRRRIKLPLTLAPGESVQGSLFFRITPSPRELTLRTQSFARERDVSVSLAPLIWLHMKMPSAPGPVTK